jgi:uncharacterized protein YdhG (YjbR/CyaY superfamily)
MKMKSAAKSIGEYIKTAPKESQKALKEMRAIIKKMAPAAEEGISYGIPVFKLNGRMFIYIAGYKNHSSIYPAPRKDPDFAEALSAYKGGKGTVQFPNDEPLPVGLVKKLVKFRMRENKVAAELRKIKR